MPWFPLTLVGLTSLIGGLFNLAWPTMMLGLVLVILWQHRQQNLLVSWVRQGGKNNPPDITSPLDEAVSLLLKRRKQSRKRKRRLQELLKTFRELAEAVPDAAMVVDSNGRLLNFNRAAQTLLGLHPRMDHGTRIDHLLRGESFEAFWHNQTGHASTTLRLPGDIAVYVEMSRVPLSQGNILLIAHDVTNVVLLNQKRKAFIDNASHELKTPLTVIYGYLEVMASGELPEHLRQPVDEMQSQASRMKTLIDDMLRLARLENAQGLLHEEIVDIEALFSDLVETMAQRFPNEVGVKLAYVEPIELYADQYILYSVLSNLLINALLHAKSRHAVELSAAVSEVDIVLMVRDDGTGIAPEHLPRVTERFYRVDDQREHSKGSGLGLAIARHGAESHGGTLEIQSTPGVGSTFSVVLPLNRLRQATT
ncbi:phosphate regulon sensor protein PhoR [Suttonella sp. R2A3]|uniref:phosphate regulon sensor histidine kinase PhoR n=1 Tax=Suttonella sp. R2A3 TaxID=2908648 RepID=UPI001F1DE883|nr:phosphate regulon sensor histidine kinase PhoR [Suttonella sp. R2A3]UJF23741.1 phosphate regulon sensor protein PhoR [Suttonella sp. R2A3]